MTTGRRDTAATAFGTLQDSICAAIEKADGSAQFRTDEWTHTNSGGGRTRTIRDGTVFEKGAVNFSNVETRLDENTAERLKVASDRISAAGISLILHPLNPYVPTAHANFRFLELANGDWWFGGGADLTPSYLFEEDAAAFHAVWKRVCDTHNAAYYAKFKAWCDRYFFLPHRQEARGVGGIFFDNLTGDFESLFTFVRACGESFAEAYLPIVQRRRGLPYGDRERTWQLRRRGRYAEFNLVHDRGTRFGLETGGRIESILASLPPLVRWDYDVTPDPGTKEAELLTVLRNPRSWV